MCNKLIQINCVKERFRSVVIVPFHKIEQIFIVADSFEGFTLSRGAIHGDEPTSFMPSPHCRDANASACRRPSPCRGGAKERVPQARRCATACPRTRSAPSMTSRGPNLRKMSRTMSRGSEAQSLASAACGGGAVRPCRCRGGGGGWRGTTYRLLLARRGKRSSGLGLAALSLPRDARGLRK